MAPLGLIVAVPAAWLTARTWAGKVLAAAVTGLVLGLAALVAGAWLGGRWLGVLLPLAVVLVAPAMILGLLSTRWSGAIAWLMRKDEAPPAAPPRRRRRA